MEKIGTGKIYCIKSNQTDRVYYGSTFQARLSNRLAGHRKDMRKYLETGNKHITSIEILKFDDHYIELISSHDNITKEELRKIEGEVIKQNKDIAINKNISGRTKKEWVSDNRKKVNEKAARFREKNREKINNNQNEKRNQNRELINMKQKEYRDKNREAINEKEREYRKKIRDENGEEISRKRRERYRIKKQIEKEQIQYL